MADLLDIKHIIDSLGQNTPVSFVETVNGFTIDDKEYSLTDMKTIFQEVAIVLGSRQSDINSVKNAFSNEIQEVIDTLNAAEEAILVSKLSTGLQGLLGLLYEQGID